MTPSERISQSVRAAADDGRTAMVAFITAGYPDRDGFTDTLTAVANVSDVVEIGVPFSDPMADGLTIQRASQKALASGVGLAWILDELATMEERPAAPLVLMSYLNPLIAMGFDALSDRMTEAGVDGLIVPDLPLEESGPLDTALARNGLALIQLVSPVTPAERMGRVCAASRGFLYAVTVTGITGGDARPAAEGMAKYLETIRQASEIPVCAGFGVRTPEQFAEIGQHSDGVVVGSALVEALERGEDPAEFLRSLTAVPVT